MTKPTILIYVSDPDPIILKEICAGIEEEGVSGEVLVQENRDIETLTYQSANSSLLGTGIGISNRSIAFTLSSLPKGTYVFRYEVPTAHQARILGTNAARTVKRKAFKEE